MFLRTALSGVLYTTPDLHPDLQASWVPLEVYCTLPGGVLREFALALHAEHYHDDVRELLLEEACRRQDVALAMTLLAKQKARYMSLNFFQALATGSGGRYHDLASLVWQKICPMTAQETKVTFQWLLDGFDIPVTTRELAVQVTRVLFSGVTQWIAGDATADTVFESFSASRRLGIESARQEASQYTSWMFTPTFSSLLLAADEAAWQQCKLDGQVVASLEHLEQEANDILRTLDCEQWQLLVTTLYSVGVVTTEPGDALAVLATITSV